MLETLSRKTSFKNKNLIENKVFGFWIYLMSDCILFAILFAVYIVLVEKNPKYFVNKEIFNLSSIMLETFLLLLSSITCSAVTTSLYKSKRYTVFWLMNTFFLGISFIYMELYEFRDLISRGYGPSHNSVLSAFFVLVGAHGLHLLSGLIWLLVLVAQLTFIKNINFSAFYTRVMCLSLFWHFLDIIWICVFSIVYLIWMI